VTAGSFHGWAVGGATVGLAIDLRLFELLNARICHDLAGPVGAIANGVELLTEFGPSDADDMLPLLASSAQQAIRRLAFYRVAFGFAGGRTAWGPAELRRLAADLFEDSRVTLDWPDEPALDAVEVDARAAKLLLVMVMLGGEAVPRGGTVTVAAVRSGDGSPSLTVSADGRGAVLHDAVCAALTTDMDPRDIDSRSAHAAFARLLAVALGTPLTMAIESDRIVLSATRADAV